MSSEEERQRETLQASERIQELEKRQVEQTEIHSKRLGDAKSEVADLQSDVSSLLKKAQDKHNEIESNQKKYNAKKTAELQRIADDAKADQKRSLGEKTKELLRRRKDLEILNKKARTKLANLPENESQETREHLELLLQRGFETQKQMEAEQRALADESKAELVALVQNAQKEQATMQKRHIEEIKEELASILDEISTHLEKLKHGFDELKIKQEQAVTELFQSALEKQELKRKELDSQRHDAEMYIEQQRDRIAVLVNEGKYDDIPFVYADLQKMLRNQYNLGEAAQKRLAMEAQAEMNAIANITKGDLSSIQGQYNQFMMNAKQELQLHTSNQVQRINSEVDMQIANNMEELHESLYERVQLFGREHAIIVNSIRSKMDKQAEDSKTRRKMEQREVIMQTVNKLKEVDQNYKFSMTKLQRDQKRIMQTTQRQLKDIDVTEIRERKKMHEDQMSQLNDEYKKTQSLIAQMEEQKREEEVTKSRLSIEEKIKIGKLAAQEQNESKELQRAALQKTREAISEIAIKMRKRRNELRQQKSEAINEKRQLEMDLNTQVEIKVKELQSTHELLVKEEQDLFQLKVEQLKDRKSKMKGDQKQIDELVERVERNKSRILSGDADDKLAQEQNELIQLVKEAQDKQDRVTQDIKEQEELAKTLMKEQINKSRIEVDEQIESYTRDNKQLTAKMGEAVDIRIAHIKMQLGMLDEKHFEEVAEVRQEAEVEQSQFRENQKQLMVKAQTQLNQTIQQNEQRGENATNA